MKRLFFTNFNQRPKFYLRKKELYTQMRTMSISLLTWVKYLLGLSCKEMRYMDVHYNECRLCDYLQSERLDKERFSVKLLELNSS